ncbi:MAG: histidine--tRNA ligase [Cyclobacteriaceae bacterium]|nr:histidine--tRNA ligase [Cyclobacteriaceae bacterium]
MSQKPTLPKGTRDFGPDIMARRNFIFKTIRNVFEKFGFMPLETPSMENLNVLTGKYGDEGDQLLFKILNSGDFLSKTSQEEYNKGAKEMLPKIAKKGLRYDLTVPFARYVVMNQHNITFPFKRYQIQPVWRADRPQKGRYQEFYQCDADVVGTQSLICESEIVQIINEVFEKLTIDDYTIKINHRGILSGIVEHIGAKGKETDFFVAIDKLDKIGLDNVLKELSSKDFSSEAINTLTPFFNEKSDINGKINFLKNIFPVNSIGHQGVEDIETILNYIKTSGMENNNHLELDFTLARGLSYYTGAIFEVKVNNASFGSVSGGGRYDNLTGVFGLPNVSGVGFSFGVDRIYDVMDELTLFPKETASSTQILITNFDEESEKHALKILSSLRSAGIKSEIFPESVKLKKQLNYADKKNVPYVLLIGEEEINSQLFTLKNMIEGKQEKLPLEKIISTLTEE